MRLLNALCRYAEMADIVLPVASPFEREALKKESDAASKDRLEKLRAELAARGGAYAESLARGKAVRMALDQVMSQESAALHEGGEVAFFPPVTGG